MKQYDSVATGKMIAHYRALRLFSQSKLAKLSGVSKGYISKIELGLAGSINLKKLYSIATALGVTVDDLLYSSLVKYADEKPEGVKGEIIRELDTATAEELDLFYRQLCAFVRYRKAGK